MMIYLIDRDAENIDLPRLKVADSYGVVYRLASFNYLSDARSRRSTQVRNPPSPRLLSGVFHIQGYSYHSPINTPIEVYIVFIRQLRCITSGSAATCCSSW